MISACYHAISETATISIVSIEQAPLFVRLSAPLLSELDARIEIDGRTKQAVVEDLLSQQLQAAPSPGPTDILDLDGVATLLHVHRSDMLERIAGGDFPARRFGTEWRCSRAAVTAWLHGTDTITDRPTGFAPG